MYGWNDTILNTTSNIGLNYEKVNTARTSTTNAYSIDL